MPSPYFTKSTEEHDILIEDEETRDSLGKQYGRLTSLSFRY